MTSHSYELLASLLEYPGPDTTIVAEDCRAALERRSSEAAARLEALAAFAAGADVREMEELYTRTFDLVPSRSLDLGFQLFGETYKRGLFLVRMKAAVTSHGIEAGAELPDHLPVLLRLLAALDGEHARLLADEVILPAVSKVLAAFGEETNPYRAPLEATISLLKADFGIGQIRPVPEERPPVVPPGRRALPVLAGSEDAP